MTTKLSKNIYLTPVTRFCPSDSFDSLELEDIPDERERRHMRLIQKAERDFKADRNKSVQFRIRPLTENGVEPTLLVMSDEGPDPWEGLQKLYLSDDHNEIDGNKVEAAYIDKEENKLVDSEADQSDCETDESTIFNPPPLNKYEEQHAKIIAGYSGNIYNADETLAELDAVNQKQRTRTKKSSIFKMIPLKRPEKRAPSSQDRIVPINIANDEIESIRGHTTVPDYIASLCNVQPSTAQAAIVSRLSEENRVEKIRHSCREGSYSSLSVDEIKLEAEREHILRFAWKGKTFKLIHLLSDRSYHADINRTDECGRTACHFAASWGDKRTLATLLRVPGVDFNMQDDEGKTPLFKAVEVNSLKTVELLLNYGADTTIVANDNRTAFEFALQNNGDNAIEIIKFFILQGALQRVDYRDGIVSCLHQLCLSHINIQKYHTAKALLDAGADANAVDGEDRTPLMLAAKSGFEHVVRLLLEAGANPTLIDANHEDALDYCKGNPGVTKIIDNAIDMYHATDKYHGGVKLTNNAVQPPIRTNYRSNSFRGKTASTITLPLMGSTRYF